MTHSHVSTNGETGHINLPARFDVMSSAQFRIPFVRLVSNASTRKVVVDCSDVSYIDSTGIGTLIAWERNCQQSGKALLLDRCSSHVVKVFKLSGVEKLFAFS